MGRLHPAHRGVDEDSPYVLRGLENRKTQLERLTGGLVLEPHPRLFYQDQTFEPPNTYRGLENEKRQKEISSLVGRCCQTFWERRYPALETCGVPRGGLSSQFFRRPGCTAKLPCCHTAGGFAPHRLDHFIVQQRKYLWRTRGGNKEPVQSINPVRERAMRTTSGVGRWMTIPPPLPFIFLMDRRLVEIRGAKRGG